MENELFDAVVENVREDIKRAIDRCTKNLEVYGPPPQNIYLLEHAYSQPPPTPAPWSSESKNKLVQNIREGQKVLYGDRQWRTPPEVSALPVRHAWRIDLENLTPIDPSIIDAQVEKYSPVIEKIENMHEIFPLVRIHFTYTPDLAEIYMDTQWARVGGSGMTYEVIQTDRGKILRSCMTRWTS